MYELRYDAIMYELRYDAIKIINVESTKTIEKNLEIGVSTKLIVTARIRGNVLLESTSLHIYKKL